MRAHSNPEPHPFAKSKKKGKRSKADFRSTIPMNNRRNVRQMPTRQFSRGR